MSSPTPSASKHGPSSSSSGISGSLRDRLAAVLPHGHRFGIHHISTPPTRTDSLCPAPPGQRPDKTYRESHFLAVSIRPPGKAVAPLKRASPGADHAKEPDAPRPALVFGVEVFIFTTAYQTTLFVSKADSTGYLPLLNLPKGTSSPIRQVCATFLAYLLDHRRRNRVQSVVNLFARAQSQYLFPGSVRNKGKHVLDDWGLVRWWCRVLNPLMEGLSKEPWASTKGYLLVPGLEEMEIRGILPRTTTSMANWVVGHPLEQTSHYTRDLESVPPRCLIPGYPDDPKCRFRDELDQEVATQKQAIGPWKSIKSLEQFWDMMAFRQECSSGRLTGFVWLVFDPPQPQAAREASVTSSLPSSLPTARAQRPADVPSRAPRAGLPSGPRSPAVPTAPSSKAAKKMKKTTLSGRIIPRAPKIKTRARNYLDKRPIATAYYYWPAEGRGTKLVDDAEYKRIVELLLHLDFSTLEKAAGSSRRWLNEVGMGQGVEGGDVVGRAVPPDSLRANGAALGVAGGIVTNLTGLVRRKAGSQPSETGVGQAAGSALTMTGGLVAASSTSHVNILGASLVRSKNKADPAENSAVLPVG
ncbi:histone acetylation protein-domain-containing protein [Staphylotrichum tortipilum]|uniref:histone acetyltransferase n=1 Tax=Staphylotrichum tortipilum TaxID=2831512 RepID=A0AAN6MS48_9PEZI|nr:histone acetylation protein-domain-containing protein [Staphylotrichum longicolle]